MSKTVTIASLIRTAAKHETEFVNTVNNVFEEADVERISEFFDRLNIPRSTGADYDLTVPLPAMQNVALLKVWDFAAEQSISNGMQRFLDRHERKIKWHAGHPSIEGAENVLLLNRAAMITTDLRLRRLHKVLDSKDELTPVEWRTSRDLMNRSFLSFRNFLNLTAGPWVDAMLTAVAREEFVEKLGNFYELVDGTVRKLEEHRAGIEERRLQLIVLPEGYPPVKPPNYFGGDLMGRGPWKQYWTNLNHKAHHFRESLG